MMIMRKKMSKWKKYPFALGERFLLLEMPKVVKSWEQGEVVAASLRVQQHGTEGLSCPELAGECPAQPYAQRRV